MAEKETCGTASIFEWKLFFVDFSSGFLPECPAFADRGRMLNGRPCIFVRMHGGGGTAFSLTLLITAEYH